VTNVQEAKCYERGRDSADVTLRKCSICFKHFCDEHAYQMSGRSFCSEGCAHYFFFHEPDE
jgi:hypothetical protein